jgi:hypothetical protein
LSLFFEWRQTGYWVSFTVSRFDEITQAIPDCAARSSKQQVLVREIGF